MSISAKDFPLFFAKSTNGNCKVRKVDPHVALDLWRREYEQYFAFRVLQSADKKEAIMMSADILHNKLLRLSKPANDVIYHDLGAKVLESLILFFDDYDSIHNLPIHIQLREHAIQNLLDQVRDGKKIADMELCDILKIFETENWDTSNKTTSIFTDLSNWYRNQPDSISITRQMLFEHFDNAGYMSYRLATKENIQHLINTRLYLSKFQYYLVTCSINPTVSSISRKLWQSLFFNSQYIDSEEMFKNVYMISPDLFLRIVKKAKLLTGASALDINQLYPGGNLTIMELA